MNLNDPSLYGVTYPQREIGPTFVGNSPLPWQNVAWQNVPRILPTLYAYGMQPFMPYGMQALPYGEKLGMPTLPAWGMQPFLPPAYGYTTPFQTAPIVPTAFNPCLGGVCNVPFQALTHGWQRPFWY
jgi:hypothetical protein